MTASNKICHGIPGNVPIANGDIVKFDVSVFTKEGFFGDNCGTVLVGDVDPQGELLSCLVCLFGERE
jgi:methionyl aminopeptidase